MQEDFKIIHPKVKFYKLQHSALKGLSEISWDEILVDFHSIEYSSFFVGGYTIEKVEDLVIDDEFVYGRIIRYKTSDIDPIKVPGKDGLTAVRFDGDNEGQGSFSSFVIHIPSSVLVYQTFTASPSIANFESFFWHTFKIHVTAFMIINPSTYEDLLQKRLYKQINVKYFKNKLNPNKLTSDMQSEDIQKLMDHYGADEATLKLKSNTSLFAEVLPELIQKLADKIDTGEVRELTITGADEENEKGELFDLVTNQVVDKITLEEKKNKAFIEKDVIFKELVKVFRKHESKFAGVYDVKLQIK